MTEQRLPVRAATVSQEFSATLCERLCEWSYQSLPQSVAHTAKLFVLDTLGVIAAARRADGIGLLNSRLYRWDAGGRATGLLDKRPLSPLSAALANGAAAHALDFDDQHDPARVHAYCVNLPAVLATAEEAGAVDGKDFLLALATGIELHARLGLACHESIRFGWQPTVSHGALAAAVAAGRVLRLPPAKLLAALGIAYHQASGNGQSLLDNVLSKRIGPGFAARNGVLSAFLALDGMSGPTRPLEGLAGLFRLYERDEVDANVIVSGLGERWELLNYAIKPFPCCRCNHSVIDLALELCREGITGDSVRSADIYVSAVNHRMIGGEYDANHQSVVHAQFNAAFAFARTLLDGKFDLESLATEQRSENRVASLAQRIRVHADPEVPANAVEPVRIAIVLGNGRKLDLHRQVLRGGPLQPLPESEVMQKFERNLAYGLGTPRSDAMRLADAVLSLEKTHDAGRTLSSLFPAARA